MNFYVTRPLPVIHPAAQTASPNPSDKFASGYGLGLVSGAFLAWFFTSALSKRY